MQFGDITLGLSWLTSTCLGYFIVVTLQSARESGHSVWKLMESKQFVHLRSRMRNIVIESNLMLKRFLACGLLGFLVGLIASEMETCLSSENNKINDCGIVNPCVRIDSHQYFIRILISCVF